MEVKNGTAAFTGSDGYITYQSSLQADCEPGNAVFPAIFPQILPVLPDGPVTVIADTDDIATVTSGRSKYLMQVLQASEYPVQDQGIPVTGTVDGDEFRLAARRVLPAVSPGNPVPALSGILIRVLMDGEGETLSMLATDKYVMSYATCPFHPAGGMAPDIIMPGTAAARLLKTTGDLTLSWDRDRITVAAGACSVTSRAIQGTLPARKIPDVAQWIPLDPAVSRMVKRASVTGALAVSITFGPELIIEASGAAGSFAESLPLGYSGEAKFSVSPQMLLDGLAGCSKPETGFTGPRNPLYIRDEGYVFALQPRRGE